MIPFDWIEAAETRIRPYIRRTPLAYDPDLDIFLKWENHQVTGSFKARGAFNKVLYLEDWERQRGLVTASAGNHGQGVALAAQQTSSPAVIFASEHASPLKVAAMRELGADVRLVPGGYGEAEQAGLAYARSSGSTWVSPYNDDQVICGQATLGLEILEDLGEPGAACWLVPVGGGGLASGIGSALETASPRWNISRPHLIGVQSEASPFMYELYQGRPQEAVVELPSLADGLSGPVEAGSLTISLNRHLLNHFVLVTEEEIRRAMAFAWRKYQERIEGSAAVGLAAVLSGRVSLRPAVVVISGGNVDESVFQQVLAREAA